MEAHTCPSRIESPVKYDISVRSGITFCRERDEKEENPPGSRCGSVEIPQRRTSPGWP